MGWTGIGSGLFRVDHKIPLVLGTRPAILGSRWQATSTALAKALNVPAPRINDIIRERRGVSADTAMRLARYFGGDARSWLNLQAAYDLRVAEIENAKRIEKEVEPAAA